jgi:hypothetical protein
MEVKCETTGVTHMMGNIYECGLSGDEYMICRCESYKYILVSLRNGNHWTNPTQVDKWDNISEAEFTSMCGHHRNEFTYVRHASGTDVPVKKRVTIELSDPAEIDHMWECLNAPDDEIHKYGDKPDYDMAFDMWKRFDRVCRENDLRE